MPSEIIARGFVPVLSSQAGSCLTMANWEKAGIQAVSYRLDDLLMKPGLDILGSLGDIRRYSAWRGLIILNASLPAPNRDGVYRFRSIYDGAWIRLDVSVLFTLITQLNPDRVILPAGSALYLDSCWQNLPPTIEPYWHASDTRFATDTDVGQYFANNKEKPVYHQGEFGLADFQRMARATTGFIESDIPAQEGVSGWVYSREGRFSVLDSCMAHAHQIIDRDCQCQTCYQGFTRAYLHHLLQHTPLLAQRYLVQHNSYYIQQIMLTRQ